MLMKTNQRHKQMERYILFVDWKNQYCENDCTTQSRGTRDQIANILWIMEKARKFQKNIYFTLLTTPKPLTVWITANYGKLLKE